MFDTHCAFGIESRCICPYWRDRNEHTYAAAFLALASCGRLDLAVAAWRGLAAEEAERALILRALKATGGHKGRTCDLLGISRPTLERKLQRSGESGSGPPEATGHRKHVARPCA